MAAPSELIWQMVTYLHTDSHVKPRRVKMHMQMRAGRKKTLKELTLLLGGIFAFVLDKSWLEEKWQSV